MPSSVPVANAIVADAKMSLLRQAQLEDQVKSKEDKVFKPISSTEQYYPPLPASNYNHDEILLAPYKYLLENPGKGIRGIILSAFNRWLKVPEDKLQIISNVIEMLHGGSLLIDDIEDNSTLRRGVPVSYKIYGIAQTINSANYVYFLALKEVQKLRLANGESGKAVEIFADELINAHRGQGIEIFWRENLVCPNEEQYLEMVGNKTSALLRLGIALMVEYRGVQDVPPLLRYTNLCTTMGNLFQIRDDYINLRSSDFAETKGFCEDLTEGKFSFPIIHCIRANPSDRQLLNILKQHTEDPNLKQYALALMERTDSFNYTKNYLQKLESETRIQISELGGNKALEGILELLRKDYCDV